MVHNYIIQVSLVTNTLSTDTALVEWGRNNSNMGRSYGAKKHEHVNEINGSIKKCEAEAVAENKIYGHLKLNLE